ncbi:hypothetical protein QBC43DRAFT_300419 [Cladorrhinum sp. PSN259]|nr:hypothetical protein QBC43DRAFT_300419 [Cladorrhinum sp. PSN259]
MRQTTLAAVAAAITNVIVASPTPADLVDQLHARAATDENQPWTNISCENPTGNSSDILTASGWWDAVKAEEAWKFGVDKWRTARDAKTNTSGFREFVVQNTLKGLLCQFEDPSYQGSNCSSSTIECDNEKGLNPAAFLLSASFMNIREMYNSLYVASSLTVPTAVASDYITKDTPWDYLSLQKSFLYSAAGAAEALYAKSYFNSTLPSFGNDTNIKNEQQETVMAVRDFSFEVAVDSWNSLSSSWTGIKTFARDWMQVVTQKAPRRAWNGDDANIAYLHTLISNGKFASGELPTRQEADKIITKTMQSFWIPFLWRLRGSYPVLINTGWDCTPDGDLHGSKMINPGENRSYEVCIDNKVYYFQDPKGEPGKLSILPETDSITRVTTYLNGTGNPATEVTLNYVTLSALAENIIARHNKLGNRNLWSAPETEEDKAALKAHWRELILGEGKTLLPAVVNIPMCDEKTVERNWKRAAKGEKLNMNLYPCNEKGEKAKKSGGAKAMGPVSWLFPMILGVIGAVSFC